VCVKCYGRNLATNKTVDIGEAVGIIAAQSIGQPGTQLTMRTFHIGGAATRISEENRTYLKYPVLFTGKTGNTVQLDNGHQLFTRKGQLTVSRIFKVITLEENDVVEATNGQKVIKGQSIIDRNGEKIYSSDIAYVHIKDNKLLLIAQEQHVAIRNGSELVVKVGDMVAAEEIMAFFDPFTEPIISEVDGVIKFQDMILGATLKEEVNEETGKIDKKVMEFSLETLQPRITILDKNGNEIAVYFLPGAAYLNVEDGDEIKAGRILAKLLKESIKTRDITGGLPRVGELFESRRPKNPTVLSKISGIVKFKGIVKGKRLIVVEDPFGIEYKHLIPMGKHLLVRDSDEVKAGEPLCDGNIDPHDVLNILGEIALQNYLVNEIQEVYRLQGVNINDKHIGIIIRQMMRKVEIVQVGDTNFIYGQQVDKYTFNEENRKVIREGGQSAVARPLLLGITRASLNIDSFISAASFQETTRVLTNAAIAGSVDHLRGLKENVIIGHQIPAGTGMPLYKNVKLFNEKMEDIDLSINRIIEEKHKKKEENSLTEENAGLTIL